MTPSASYFPVSALDLFFVLTHFLTLYLSSGESGNLQISQVLAPFDHPLTYLSPYVLL